MRDDVRGGRQDLEAIFAALEKVQGAVTEASQRAEEHLPAGRRPGRATRSAWSATSSASPPSSVRTRRPMNEMRGGLARADAHGGADGAPGGAPLRHVGPARRGRSPVPDVGEARWKRRRGCASRSPSRATRSRSAPVVEVTARAAAAPDPARPARDRRRGERARRAAAGGRRRRAAHGPVGAAPPTHAGARARQPAPRRAGRRGAADRARRSRCSRTRSCPAAASSWSGSTEDGRQLGLVDPEGLIERGRTAADGAPQQAAVEDRSHGTTGF